MGLDRAYWSNFRGEELQGSEASLEWDAVWRTPTEFEAAVWSGPAV